MLPQTEFLPANWADIHAELQPQLADLLNTLEEFKPTTYGLPPFEFSDPTLVN